MRVHSYGRLTETVLAQEVVGYLTRTLNREAFLREREQGKWLVVYVGRFSSSRNPEAVTLLERVRKMSYGRRRAWNDAIIQELPEGPAQEGGKR